VFFVTINYVRKSNIAKPPPTAPPEPPSKPVSLRDLAAYLGLSRTTVSLVLNNSPVAQGLTQETRDRVLRAASELHYKANYFARMLNNKRSHMVGILSPDLGEGYDSEILNGIERLLIERDYLYFVSSHHWNRELIRAAAGGLCRARCRGRDPDQYAQPSPRPRIFPWFPSAVSNTIFPSRA
jgi:transcriptional regulator with XRE-family HTH domain